MESPGFPLGANKTILYSVLMILWWIGIWGIADTVIHLVFKGATLKELGVYIFFVVFVLSVITFFPDLIHKL